MQDATRGPQTAALAFPSATGFWLTRFLMLRLLGFVYIFAFLSLALQVQPLLGHDGLLPADAFLARAAAQLGSPWQGFLALPSAFWLGISDRALLAGAWLGVGLSAVLLAGFANALLLLALWALYLSFVHIGQDWYAYGWEIQLLETGFLAVFLCPLLDARPFPRRPPPTAVIWLLRWLIFRVMLGAGLIKLRGDPCWRDLSCLDTHFETQPIPGPLSRAFHELPPWAHRGGVLFNHVAELVAPWLVFMGRLLRRSAGLVMLALQGTLLLSGNLSFLNWLTIVPILACFDDAFLAHVLPRALVARAARAAARATPARVQHWLAAALVVLVALLSVGPVLNLLSPDQRMNTSFDSLDLVNSYGAFGSVGKQRDEIVFEGTDAAVPDAHAVWREYAFPGKPGDVARRPPLLAPYQPRLDWALWFAAMSTPERYPWAVHLVWKLLQGDAPTLRLLANDPFPDVPPRYVRALLYRYRFAPPASGAWWERTLVGEWLPPLSADDPRLLAFLRAYGWLPAAPAPQGSRAPS
jgi:Lipase maturation factor